MKFLFRFLFLVIVLAGGAYGGLWYLTCQEMEKQIPREGKVFYFGIENNNSLSFVPTIASVNYSGYERARATLVVTLLGMDSKSLFSVKGAAAVESAATLRAKDAPMKYYITGELYGDSLLVEFADYANMEMSQTINKLELAKKVLSGKAGGFQVKFKKKDLLINRIKGFAQYYTNPKKLFEDITQVSFLPTSMVMSTASGDPVATTEMGAGYVAWDINDDGTLSMDTKLDMVSRYGKGIKEVFNLSDISKSTGDTSETAAKVNNIMGAVAKIQGALFQDVTAKVKGRFQLKLPAEKVGLMGLNQDIPGIPVPPIEMKFENFEFQLPLPLSRTTTLNGQVAFMRGDGKPLKIDFRSEGSPLEGANSFDELMGHLISDEEIKTLIGDATSFTPSAITTLAELESSRGAVVMVVSGLRASYDNFLKAKSSGAVSLTIETPSEKFSPLEMLGAKGNFKFESIFGPDIGINLAAHAQGATAWEATGSFKNLEKIFVAFKDPLRVFAARSFLATFFDAAALPKELSDQDKAKERKLIEFIFSDPLFDELIGAFSKVCRVIDQTPETTDEVTIKIAGALNQITINGKSFEEYHASLMPEVLNIMLPLGEKLKTAFAELMPAAPPPRADTSQSSKIEFKSGVTQENTGAKAVPSQDSNTIDSPGGGLQASANIVVQDNSATPGISLTLQNSNAGASAIVMFESGAPQEIFYQINGSERQSTGEAAYKDPKTGRFPALQIIHIPDTVDYHRPVTFTIDWIDSNGKRHGPQTLSLDLKKESAEEARHIFNTLGDNALITFTHGPRGTLAYFSTVLMYKKGIDSIYYSPGSDAVNNRLSFVPNDNYLKPTTIDDRDENIITLAPDVSFVGLKIVFKDGTVWGPKRVKVKVQE